MTNYAQHQADAKMRGIRDIAAALAVDYDRLEELREEFEAFERDEREAAELGRAEWPSDYTSNPGEFAHAYGVGRELAELEDAAGDCESREDAEQRVLEDALSAEVRSDWHTPGEDAAPAEFRIVLCTGDPHVEIRGELDPNGEPDVAWLMYSDWGQGMTERQNQPGDEAALLDYARVMGFGEY